MSNTFKIKNRFTGDIIRECPATSDGYADLSYADLSCADLRGAKEDLFDVLSAVPNEAHGLLANPHIAGQQKGAEE